MVSESVRARPRAPGGLRSALRNRSVRALYLAETQSMLGDQLARVALAVLVFERTHSTIQTALTYALTYLPAIIGGFLVSSVSGRLGRRNTLIALDSVRCVLVAAMALPHIPLPVMLSLLSTTILIGPIFTSSEVGFISTELDDDGYRVITALRMVTNQSAQVVGFACGAGAIALLGPRGALIIDAATYLISVLAISFTVRPTSSTSRGTRAVDGPDGPAVSAAGAEDGIDHSVDHSVDHGEEHGADGSGAATTGIAVVRRIASDRRTAALVGLVLLGAFYVVPEGLAAPYAAASGGSAPTVGLLMAAMPLGTALGAGVLVHLVPDHARWRVLRIMAMVTGLPLAACVIDPGIAVSAALWGFCGLFGAYFVDVSTTLIRTTPDRWRDATIGVIGAALTAVQGLGVLVFGVVADAVGPHDAVALAGAIGMLLAIGCVGMLDTDRAIAGAHRRIRREI